MAGVDMSEVTRTLKDAAYVTVGFGVLAFQKAQVRRRELEKQLESQSNQWREQVAGVAGELRNLFGTPSSS
ncbi:MAG: hypothetical protein KY454_09260 [Actinobacteria bacterium]|nr:hypothetical protein [Actinomycetota bacterium]MBW3650860.1 hypothetical protein [Actinomycetota bacterium]